MWVHNPLLLGLLVAVFGFGWLVGWACRWSFEAARRRPKPLGDPNWRRTHAR